MTQVSEAAKIKGRADWWIFGKLGGDAQKLRKLDFAGDIVSVHFDLSLNDLRLTFFSRSIL